MTQAATPPEATLEDFYANLAEAIDTAGPHREALLLSRLALLLAHALDDPARAVALVSEAARDGSG
jgi:hypothetical protein